MQEFDDKVTELIHLGVSADEMHSHIDDVIKKEGMKND